MTTNIDNVVYVVGSYIFRDRVEATKFAAKSSCCEINAYDAESFELLDTYTARYEPYAFEEDYSVFGPPESHMWVNDQEWDNRDDDSNQHKCI